MQSPCSPQLHEGTRLTRAKCSQCRQDKKRCEPTRRHGWEPNEDRCQRCLRLGYACGPLESPARKLRQKRSTAGLHTRNVPSFTTGWLGDLKNNVRAIIIEDSNRYHPENTCLILKGNKTSSTVLQFAPHDMHERAFSSRIAYEPDCSSTCSKDTSFLSRHTRELAAVYFHLATVVAAQQLFLRCQSDLKYLDQKFAVKKGDQGSFFHVVHEQLYYEFHCGVSFARSQFEALEGPSKEREEVKLNLWLYKERILRYQQLLINSSSSEIWPCDTSMVIPITNSIFDEHDVMLCTANVMVDRRSLSKEQKSHPYYPDGMGSLMDYGKAAERLKRLLYNISIHVTNTDHPTFGEQCLRMLQKLRDGFPASHIAFWNYNTSAAVQLWKPSQGCGELRDLFGRSFLHIAVEARDLNTLKHIAKAPEFHNSFRDAGLDNQGRSLLSTAAILGDQEMFAICISEQTHKHTDVAGTGRDLLDIAIASCNRKVVQILLEEKMICLFMTDVFMAVENGCEDMAVSFLNELSSFKTLDLAYLMNVAHQKQMQELEGSIIDILGACNHYSGLEEDYLCPSTDFLESNLESSDASTDLLATKRSPNRSAGLLPGNDNFNYYDPSPCYDQLTTHYESAIDPKLLSYDCITG